MKAGERITDRVNRMVTQARNRSEPVDHLFRTVQRYLESFGSRLAAAIAYYGFFAVFALGVVTFSVLGFLVEYQVDIQEQVEEYLEENLPVLEPEQVAAGRGLAGAFGLIGLVFTGLAWVEALRSSQRELWRLEQAPGSLIKRRLVDVGLLALLGLLLGVSLAVTGVIEELLALVPLLRPAGWLLMVAVNVVLAMALLMLLPRLRMPIRRVLGPAVAVAIGLVILNTVGRFYFLRVQENPAYAVVATAAGVLVYLYLVHQLILLAAAWAATSRYGEVVDPTATDQSDADQPAAH